MKKINDCPFDRDEVLFNGEWYESYFSNEMGHFLRVFNYNTQKYTWYELNDEDWAAANIKKFGYEKWA